MLSATVRKSGSWKLGAEEAPDWADGLGNGKAQGSRKPASRGWGDWNWLRVTGWRNSSQKLKKTVGTGQFVTLTQALVTWEEGATTEKDASIGVVCRQAHGAFSWLMMWELLGCMSKQMEQSQEQQTRERCPSPAAPSILPPGSCLDFSSSWLGNRSQISPFSPKLLSDYITL